MSLENSLPELSLSADAYPFFPGTGPPHVEKYQRPPKQILEARVLARDACEKLLQLLSAPELSFIVQDLDEVVQAAKTRRPKDQEEGKIKFEAHDFFEPQPIENADVYLLRFICYDHSDKYAAKMANIESAMGPTSRIIIMDGVLPPPGTLSRAEERRLRIMDMNMMISFNSGERDLDGWMSLFKMADSRLGLRHIVTPPGSALSIMELDLRGPDRIWSPI